MLKTGFIAGERAGKTTEISVTDCIEELTKIESSPQRTKNDNKQNPEREQWCWYLSWEHLLIPRDLQLHANQARWLKNRDRPMDYTKWKDGSETLTKKWNNKIPKSWYLSWKNEQNFSKDSIVQGEKWVFAYFISISSGLRKNDHLFWKFLTRRLITIGLELKLYYLLL